MSFNTQSRLSRTAQTTRDAGHTSRYQTVHGGTTTVALVKGILWWRKLRSLVTTTWRKTLATVTPAGWLLIFAAVIGLSLGLSFGWIEFVVAGLIALTLIVFAVPFLFGSKAYEVSFTLDRDRVVAGQEIVARIGVQNVSKRVALAGIVDLPLGEGLIEVDVPFLRPGALHSEELVIPSQARSVVTVGPASTVRTDPFGLFRRERSWQGKETLYIHPQTSVLPATSTGFIRDLEGNPDRQIVNDDLSFHAIREYQPGDSRRHVDWKSTAKTGNLMVRQYEETKRSQMLVVLDTSINHFRDADEFELAVSAAASIGLRGIRDGRELQIVLGEEVPEFAVKQIMGTRELNTRSTRNMLDEFAGVKHASHVTSLTSAASISAERYAGISIAFLVSGSAISAREFRKAALAFPSNVAVVGVVCDMQAELGLKRLGDIRVLSIGLVDDLRQLLLRGA